MRNSKKLLALELELYKLRVELDLVYQVLDNLISAHEAQNIDSGKWYVRRPRPDFDN